MKIADTHDEVNMTETMPYVDMKTNNARKTKLLTEVPVQIANTYAEISDVTDQKIIANCEAEDEVLFRVPIPRWQHTSKSHFKEQLYSNNPDGSVNSDDSTNPDGSVNSDGSSDSDDSTNPDGSSDSTNPDGSSDPTNPDGSVNSDDSSDSTNPDDYKYPEGPENVDFTSPNLLDNDNNEAPNVITIEDEVTYIILWILKYQQRFKLSDTCIEVLIKYFAKILPSANVSKYHMFPKSLYLARKRLGLNERSRYFAVCPTCHKLYLATTIINAKKLLL